MTKSAVTHTVLLVLAVLLFGGVMLWGYLDQNNYFYHVKVARITSNIWDNHQVKDCASWNAKTEQPVLECDGGHSEIQQLVPVRFYGNTRRDLDSETLRFHWMCQKNEGYRTPISCKLASEP
jgi:hypothetical protein